jgi:hypothetical protein
MQVSAGVVSGGPAARALESPAERQTIMKDHSLVLSETNKAALTEVEFAALQAVNGGYTPLSVPTPPPDPTGGFCGTVPHPPSRTFML